MRNSIQILVMVFTAVTAMAQPPFADSLQQVVDSQQGLQKIKTLNKLSPILLHKDINLAKSFAEAAIEEAALVNDWQGQAEAYDNLGNVFQQKFDYQSAMEVYTKAMKLRDGYEDHAGKALSRINVGWIFLLMEDFGQAEEYFINASKIADKNRNPDLQAESLKGLGNVYLAKKIYGKALDQYNQAVALKLEAGKIADAAGLAFQLGNISTDLGDQEGALTYYQTSLDLHRETNDRAKIADNNHKIALALLAQSAPEEALDYNQEGYEIRKELEDQLGQAECLKNFGLIYQSLGKSKRASDYFTRSKKVLAKIPVRPGVPDIYQDIANGYAEMGNYQNAYAFHNAYSKSRNEIFNQEKSKALIDLTAKYESEFEAREKQQKIELLEIENANSRKVSYFLFAVVGLALMLLGSLFMSYRRKQKDNQLLREKNDEILRQKEEIDHKNVELETKNISLDLLNKKLLYEISERETIEKSSFARDRFLATMSHEMRTPLNVITGLTHILLESEPRTDQIEQLRTLQFSANDLVVFINDVLDFSKIEAGKLNLEDREFAPQDVLEDVNKRFSQRAEESGILFNYYFDNKIPEALLGDEARLNQILTSLLTNTFQHTKEGYIKVDVSLHELKAREAMLEIVVEGSDGGVERQTLEELFKPWNAGDADFEGYDGEQFSMTITKRLIELQNGKIEVEIEQGEGTAFVVLLPFKLVVKKSDVSIPLDPNTQASIEGTHILVVEDNKINQLVVSKMLRKMGVIVNTADNGFEAIEAVNNDDYDLILMDIQMPEMDGYRATAEIRRHPSENKRDVPIIALTASAFLTEKEKAVLFGMNDHVGKPFSPEELMEKIRNCLAAYRSA